MMICMKNSKKHGFHCSIMPLISLLNCSLLVCSSDHGLITCNAWSSTALSWLAAVHVSPQKKSELNSPGHGVTCVTSAARLHPRSWVCVFYLAQPHSDSLPKEHHSKLGALVLISLILCLLGKECLKTNLLITR